MLDWITRKTIGFGPKVGCNSNFIVTKRRLNLRGCGFLWGSLLSRRLLRGSLLSRRLLRGSLLSRRLLGGGFLSVCCLGHNLYLS